MQNSKKEYGIFNKNNLQRFPRYIAIQWDGEIWHNIFSAHFYGIFGIYISVCVCVCLDGDASQLVTITAIYSYYLRDTQKREPSLMLPVSCSLFSLPSTLPLSLSTVSWQCTLIWFRSICWVNLFFLTKCCGVCSLNLIWWRRQRQPNETQWWEGAEANRGGWLVCVCVCRQQIINKSQRLTQAP